VSFEPKIESDGFRYYGRWAGSPRGQREDKTCCIVSVHEPGRGIIIHQCSKKRGHGPNGLYCSIHDPAAVEKRRLASEERYRKERENSPWARLEKAQATIRELEAKIAELESQGGR